MRKKQHQPRQLPQRDDDLIVFDLPAPSGWSKKFSPSRDEIVFISPTGEQIRTKRRLEQYLQSRPRGPAISEFDWGTGKSPRRSAKLGHKSKAIKHLDSEAPKKRQKKSSGTGKSDEETDSDGEDEAAEHEDTPTEAERSTEVPVTYAEGSGNQETAQAIDESPPP